MKNIRIILLLALTSLMLCLYAQSATLTSIYFVPTYEQQPLLLTTESNNNVSDIEAFKFYISAIELYKGGELVFFEKNSFHLLDVTDASTLKIDLIIPENTPYSSITFNIGIDSTTHAAGVFGGDLDPMHGMYWTWQSGYINVKLEGSNSACPSRGNRFQFHLGGYQYPFDSLQKVTLNLPDKKDVKINIDLDKFFSAINLKESYHIMSPGAPAVELARLFATTFQLPDEK